MYKANIANIDLTCFNSTSQAAEYILKEHLYSSSIAIAINPEKIINSLDCKETASIISKAAICYPDGIGVVKLAEKKLGKKIKRLPGCELWEELMVSSIKDQVPIYLLGGTCEVVKETYSKLVDKGINIVGYHDGYFESDEVIIEKIRQSKARILTVAMGSPRQEIFMEKCKNSNLSCFMMGVGGTYNVFTGRVTRAPSVFRLMNLEWLYRLLSEPSRLFRQTKLVRFMLLAMKGEL